MSNPPNTPPPPPEPKRVPPPLPVADKGLSPRRQITQRVMRTPVKPGEGVAVNVPAQSAPFPVVPAPAASAPVPVPAPTPVTSPTAEPALPKTPSGKRWYAGLVDIFSKQPKAPTPTKFPTIEKHPVAAPAPQTPSITPPVSVTPPKASIQAPAPAQSAPQPVAITPPAMPSVPAPVKEAKEEAPKTKPEESNSGLFGKLFTSLSKKKPAATTPPDAPIPQRIPPQKIPATPPVKQQADLPLPGLQLDKIEPKKEVKATTEPAAPTSTPIPATPILPPKSATPQVESTKTDAVKVTPPQQVTPAQAVPVTPLPSLDTSKTEKKVGEPVQLAHSTSSPAADPTIKPKTLGRITPGFLSVKKMQADQPRARRQRAGEQPVGATLTTGTGSPADEPSATRRSIPLVVIVAMLLVMAGVGGYFIWQALRETRLTITVHSEGIQIDPQALLVLDFEQRIRMIRRDLEDRRRPIRAELKEARQSLEAASRDLNGRKQERLTLSETIENEKRKVPQILRETNESLSKFWEKEYSALDAEYDKGKEDFYQAVVAKTKELKLAFDENLDNKAPEVVANSFRLALYGAPKEIDVAKERTWVEDQLKAWRASEEDWTKRRAQIRDQSVEMRKPVGDKIDAINNRVARFEEDLAKIDSDMGMVESEVHTFELRVAAAEQKEKDALQPFYDGLLLVPDEFTRQRLILGLNGSADLRELDRRKDLLPGKYRILVRGNRDGETVWATKDFEIKEFETTPVVIETEDFKSARALLE